MSEHVVWMVVTKQNKVVAGIYRVSLDESRIRREKLVAVPTVTKLFEIYDEYVTDGDVICLPFNCVDAIKLDLDWSGWMDEEIPWPPFWASSGNVDLSAAGDLLSRYGLDYGDVRQIFEYIEKWLYAGWGKLDD